jgi:tetratricopeptide (TPR) repeat protein
MAPEPILTGTCGGPRPRLRLALLAGGALCLAACAAAPPAPPPTVPELVYAEPGQFGSRPDIPTPDDIHRLTPEQQRSVLEFIDAPLRAAKPRHRRVFEYLERMTHGFHYQGETLMASDALALRRGNCLSLAILTTAIARVAGVEVGYQLADDEPVFEWNGSLVKKGVHVRTRLYEPEPDPGDGGLLFSRSALTIDYFPTRGSRFIRNLTEDGYVAMYYGNIAVEAIERGDFRTGYWYALESLTLAPDSSEGLNTLAVVYARAGDERKAEQIYLYGIEHAEEKLSLLKNYRALLLRAGRHDEARAIEAQLARMDDPSPMHWIQLARSAYDDGEYELAVRYFRRVVDLAPYMHEGYFGMARAYYMAGQLERAEAALRDALELAEAPRARSLYQAKLAVLGRELYN